MAIAPPLTQVIDLLGRIDTAWLIEPRIGRDLDWKPETPEIAGVVAELVAPENCDALTTWYGRYAKSEMNPNARWFCEYLERRIGAALAR